MLWRWQMATNPGRQSLREKISSSCTRIHKQTNIWDLALSSPHSLEETYCPLWLNYIFKGLYILCPRKGRITILFVPRLLLEIALWSDFLKISVRLFFFPPLAYSLLHFPLILLSMFGLSGLLNVFLCFFLILVSCSSSDNLFLDPFFSVACCNWLLIPWF